MPLRSLSVFVLISILAAAQAFGQYARRGEPGPRLSPAFRADSDLVLINASVLDGNGKFVSGVDANSLHVTDENQPVPIRQFALESAPVSTIILLDTSGSMQNALEPVRAGLKRYLDASMPGDDFCLIAFNGRVSGSCTFTTGPERILDEARSRPANGATALVDAVVFALNEVKKGANSRRAVLVLTDGADTHSRYTWRELKERARETTASVYAVMPPAWGMFDSYSAAELRDVAELTGGAVFEIRNRHEYPDFFEKMDLHRQYVIGFAPAITAGDGRYRRVGIHLDNPEKRRLTVYWRRGYYSRAAR